MALNTDELKRFGRLYLARKKIREKDRELTKEIGKLEGPLMEHMATEEVDKVSLKGGITLNISTIIYAKKKAPDHLIAEALKAIGRDDLVNTVINSTSLSKAVREIIERGEDLPEEFRGLVAAEPKSNLKARKL
jgi:hypothetical protein